MKTKYKCSELNEFIEKQIDQYFILLKKYKSGSPEFNYCWDVFRSMIDGIRYNDLQYPVECLEPINSVCSDEV